jgi:hypothetical protein
VGTESDIIAYVRRSLGYGKVDVELTDDHFADAVMAAKLWYAQIIGQAKSTTIALASGTSEYAVPDDCDAVIDVVSDVADSALSWGFPDVPVNLTPLLPRAGTGAGYMADLTQVLQYTGALRRTVARDQDWAYDEARRVLQIAPMNGAASQVRIWYVTSAVDVTKIRASEYHLVREYALACAGEVLGGAIRAKYVSAPGAMGEFTLNGDMMQSNATARKQELTDQLRKLQPPVGFVVG